jgi:signal transduction histidine kinase
MPYAVFLGHLHPDDRPRVRSVLSAARRAGSSFEYEHRIRRADGAERSLYSRGEVLRDETGEATAITAITQDLTERKRIEAELRASHEQLRRLSSHLQAAREEERTRMSREIHDELGGTLTGLKMDMARLAKNADSVTPAELRKRTQTMSDMIDSTVKVVRRIASDLRPGILDDFGLAAAIEWQLQEFCARAGLEYDYQADDELDLDPASSTALFRLFQETLTNVARHAQATRVRVRLETQPGELALEISDNGRGITPAEIANVQSLGLLGMRERVHLLHGQLSITGVPGEGTTVLVRVPIAAPNRILASREEREV